MTGYFRDARTGMIHTKTRTHREQLLAVQAHAESCGYHGDELKEIMQMLAQPPRDSGNNRRAL